MSSPRKILVVGGTGYVGGRLVPLLLDAGHEVRVLARSPVRAQRFQWSDDVELVQGDVLERESLDAAFVGCSAAYYLVHSMGSATDFEETDQRAATNFRDAADAAGVERIVYLGGMGDGDELSAHLSSRQEVGQILASGTTPCTELRAAVIIGSGSLSFEMLRYLTEVLPVMTTPTWVRTRCQPIAIRDVLHYLVGVLNDSERVDRRLDIGGPDVLSYQEMMQVFAEEAGLRRRVIVPVPVLSPGLSSRWVGLVTPLPSGIARPLIDSLRHEVVMSDHAIDDLVPHQPIGFDRQSSSHCAGRGPKRSTHGGATPGSRRPTRSRATPTGPAVRPTATTRPSRRPLRRSICTGRSHESAGPTATTWRTGRGG